MPKHPESSSYRMSFNPEEFDDDIVARGDSANRASWADEPGGKGFGRMYFEVTDPLGAEDGQETGDQAAKAGRGEHSKSGGNRSNDRQETKTDTANADKGSENRSTRRGAGKLVIDITNGDDGSKPTGDKKARRGWGAKKANKVESDQDPREDSHREADEDHEADETADNVRSEAASQLDMNQPWDEWAQKLNETAEETRSGSWTGDEEREAEIAEQRRVEEEAQKAYEKKHRKRLKAEREQAERDAWHQKLTSITETEDYRPGNWMSHEEKVSEGLIHDYKTGEDYMTAQARQEAECKRAERGDPHVMQYTEFNTPKDVWDYTNAVNNVFQYERSTVVGSQNLQGNFKADEDNSSEALRDRLIREHWKWVEKHLATEDIKARRFTRNVYADYADSLTREEGHEDDSFTDFLENAVVISNIEPTPDALEEINELREYMRQSLSALQDGEGNPYYTETEVDVIMRGFDKVADDLKADLLRNDIKDKAEAIGGLTGAVNRFIEQSIRSSRARAADRARAKAEAEAAKADAGSDTAGTGASGTKKTRTTGTWNWTGRSGTRTRTDTRTGTGSGGKPSGKIIDLYPDEFKIIDADAVDNSSVDKPEDKTNEDTSAADTNNTDSDPSVHDEKQGADSSKEKKGKDKKEGKPDDWFVDFEQLIPNETGIEQLKNLAKQCLQEMAKAREAGNEALHTKWRQNYESLMSNIELSQVFHEVQLSEDEKREIRMKERNERERYGKELDEQMALDTIVRQWSVEIKDSGIPSIELDPDQPIYSELQKAAARCREFLTQSIRDGDGVASLVWQERLRLLHVAEMPYIGDNVTTLNMLNNVDFATA